MLPQWQDEVVIYVAPHRVALARVKRGFRRAVTEITAQDVPLDPTGSANSAFDALTAILADSQWHDAKARVVFADAWARYAVVPSPAVALDADGRMSYARYVLDDTYGDTVAAWAMTLTDSPPGKPYLACATPETLKAQLDAALSSVQLKLISMQPQLVVSFNAWRRDIPSDDCWFVSVDKESLSAVQVKNGVWNRVHTARLSGDWIRELQRLRALGRFTEASVGASQMYIDAPVDMRKIGRISLPDLNWLEAGADRDIDLELKLLQRVAV